MRRVATSKVFDNLHKVAVIACMGMTLYGSVIVGRFTYRHFTYVRPQIQAAKAEEERELLAEGSSLS